jgi:hypothetical protein
MRLVVLRITLGIIAAFQLVLGLMFLFAPDFYASAVGLDPAPDWVPWMFGMFSARAIGFTVGLALAIADPFRHRAWIAIMIGVQAIDWLVTASLVVQGTLTIAQVSTAGFMPVLFIIALALTFPRRRSIAASTPARA